MAKRLGAVSVLVRDYTEAIEFFTKKLNFILQEDTILSDTKRWVVVSPQGREGCALILAKAVNDEQKQAIGNQSGGRVFLFLYTNDFDLDFEDLIKHGVEIFRKPETQEYGRVLVFLDLYGNKWDLIEKIF